MGNNTYIDTESISNPYIAKKTTRKDLIDYKKRE